MTTPLDAMKQPFLRRLRGPAWWNAFAYRAPRHVVTLGLALAPPLIFLAVALAFPAFRSAATDPQHVRDAFARFISGLITAATIAVSFSALALRRGLKGIGELREHVEADLEFRARIRRDGGHESLPVTIGPFLAVLLRDLARKARSVRDHAGPADLAFERDGVTLRDYLDTLETRALLVARECEETEDEPDSLLAAALDFEQEYASHLARRFARSEALAPPTREGIAALVESLGHCDVARSYVKTLDTQWGLSRMSHAIAVSSFAAIFLAAGLVLGYDAGAAAALGVRGAVGLVALGLFTVAFPLAAFVSHSVRSVFVNQHSLPLGAFALGPEKRAFIGRARPRRSRTA
jgi:hypothetical protein